MKPTLTLMKRRQQGVMLLEALIGILIFSVGILAMVGMQAAAFSASADAKYRAEAAAFANQIISDIWMGVDRSDPTGANLITTLNNFQFNTGGSDCAFSGGAADGTNGILTGWVSAVTNTTTGLLGATTAMQQVLVSTTDLNRVTVTVCWQTPQDARPRKHQVLTYVF